MDLSLRKAIYEAISNDQASSRVIESIDFNDDGNGFINYNLSNVFIANNVPGFTAGRTSITDEEMVRAYLLLRLITHYQYPSTPQTLEVEKVYKPVGRPQGKGGRIDVQVRKPSESGVGDSYLFIECKAPDKFDEDLDLIDGQLFRLSRQEPKRPKFLIYYTTELKVDGLKERIILIDTEAFPDFQSWDQAGQPITDTIPQNYGVALKRRYANVPAETNFQRPLDKETTPETFHRLRTDIHDVIWGGGGTNNNEVFVIIMRLILCKIFDEKETPPNTEYQFQRFGNAISPESSDVLVERMNTLYQTAEDSYLALSQPSAGPAFDTSRVSSEKIAYVIGRFEGLSITENRHPGDLLGEFFEQIISQDFTQTKGQFFTPIKLVKFMLQLSGAATKAQDTMLHARDHLGRPRLPYVIDPACGSGTFLIEYMKLITSTLGNETTSASLPNRIQESHSVWFSGPSGNVWAREYLFGIENNYDLGLSSKVNMVLHGDGSMNIWLKSALFPFEEYWAEGRNNILGISKKNPNTNYSVNVNEQFDIILSNPPFSIKFATEEKRKISDSFEAMSSAQSEAIFIERWYQLLREGGTFCCILPEAILDASTYSHMRFFLIKNFHIDAVISLPYDSFRPFTSTKTCIVLAKKRSEAEIAAFETSITTHSQRRRSVPTFDVISKVVEELGWAEDKIFMAEPKSVGYKRRKNLPDLLQPNLLYQEDTLGNIAAISPEEPETVLDYFHCSETTPPNSELGFWTNLRNIGSRKGFRLDPKYRWLWDYQSGIVFGDPTSVQPLSKILKIVKLPVETKGELSQDTNVIDLEYVESRQALVRDDTPILDIIGSDKVKFEGCDLVISKLEPYLGKIILNPNPSYIGSTEWVGLKILGDIPSLLLTYILMLPMMLESYRRLQSGKRHARFDPKEFLELRLELPNPDIFQTLAKSIEEQRKQIIVGRQQ